MWSYVELVLAVLSGWATLVLPQVSSPNFSASLTSSAIRKLSKMVPDFTYSRTNQIIFGRKIIKNGNWYQIVPSADNTS